MPALTREEVVAYLSQLSRAELRALILDLEDLWGIERPHDGRPVEVTMGMPYPSADDRDFALRLLDPGPKRVLAMKVLRERRGVSLQEAQALIQGAPGAMIEGIDVLEARALQEALAEIGARSEVVER